jgi:glutamine amidotransferase-like uncharacterized protein
LSQSKLNATPSQIIYIYSGPGTSSIAINHTQYTLNKLLSSKYHLKTIDQEEVKNNLWVKNAALFIMPGGADIMYARSLKGLGNQQIRSYVQDGGRYLGICAGAYYGCKRLSFAHGTSQEIASDRELAFFPDTAEGPTLKPWDHKTNSGADIANVQWVEESGPFPKNHNLSVYYNGGGHFVNVKDYQDVTPLANYVIQSQTKTAIVDIAFGKGQAILSGVHCEFAPELLDMSDPFLAPLHPQLMSTNDERQVLMMHLLQRLNVETVFKNISN